MGKIKILPEKVANQIAAGEVISRPASCVKEMLENSIDAGASFISVSVKDAGKKLIGVTDNGRGMDEKDAEAAFKRHATSKISSIEDLNYIETLGFRGEALASIASVAGVSLLTKTDEEEAGTYIEAAGAKILKTEKRAARAGTVINVRGLFYNTPARKKFLRKNYTEEAHIIDAVASEGLAREGLSLKLTIDDKEVVVFPEGSEIREKIRIMYGRETAEGLVEIENFSDNVKVYGYVTKPEITRNNRSAQYIFVNRRAVTSRRLNYAVTEGYGTMLMRGRFPAAFIFIDVNPSLVDVNVHPAKAEVKFKNEGLVYGMIKSAVSRAFEEEDLAAAPRPRAEGWDGFSAPRPEKSPPSVFSGVSEEPALFERKKTEVTGGGESVEVKSGRRDFLNITALGQVNNTYIAGDDGGALVIIDQHAAHEKVLFEKFMKGINKGDIKAQELLVPEVFEVSAAEKKIVENKKEIFEKAGFSIEPFGENEYKISSHPVIIRQKEVKEAVREITGALRKKESAPAPEVLRDVVALMSCRAAVKGGDRLSMREIENLLSDFFDLDEPYSCPHGRPPIVKVSYYELEKMFKRKL